MDIPQEITEQINAKSNSTLLKGSPKYYTYISGAEYGYSLAMVEVEKLKATKLQLQSGINVMGERCEELRAENERLKAQVKALNNEVDIMGDFIDNPGKL